MIKIRAARHDDVWPIVELGRKTFVETYGDLDHNGWVTQYIEEKFSEQQIRSELESKHEQFFLACNEDFMVGFTKLRDDRLPRGLDGKKVIELERIYVLKEFQGLKVGRELIGTCIETARDAHYDAIWLQVWQKNSRAIEFYQKAGFVVYETALFQYMDEEHQDYLMRFDLYY